MEVTNWGVLAVSFSLLIVLVFIVGAVMVHMIAEAIFGPDSKSDEEMGIVRGKRRY
jgi:hypothetical protein